MFDPVWLGNHIVPRWEALLIVGGSIVSACLLAFGLVICSCWLALKASKRLSKMW